MKKNSFSSSTLPPGLSEKQQLALWFQHNDRYYGRRQVAMLDDIPFSASIDFAQLGAVSFGHLHGSLKSVERAPSDFAADSDDRYSLLVNRGTASALMVTRGRDVWLAPGEAILRSRTESSHLSVGINTSAWAIVIIPRAPFIRTSRHADDAIGRALPAATEAIQFITRYSAMLLAEGAPRRRGAADRRFKQPRGYDGPCDCDADDRGRARASEQPASGSARRVTRAIGARFAEPDISPSAIGATMGLSVRYVHHILQETGISFSERVLELRLARALSLLIGHEGHSLRVSDAALAAGFSDLSYFNRCFRRRYGVTPTTARGA